MADGQDYTNPAMVADLIATFSRVFDRAPEELAAIHDKVIEQLEGAKVDEKDPWKHVAEHFSQIFPAIMSEPDKQRAESRLVQEYAKLPVTPDTRLRQGNENSVGFAVVLGGAIGVAVAAAIVGYCLGGEDPAPGESVEVRC